MIIDIAIGVFIGVTASHYFSGLLFTLFKANKYEETLSEKISKEVTESLKVVINDK